jgi:hypothetical protein
LLRCLDESGLRVIDDRDEVGLYHTLLKCRKGVSGRSARE